jgi:hypothetical protein
MRRIISTAGRLADFISPFLPFFMDHFLARKTDYACLDAYVRLLESRLDDAQDFMAKIKKHLNEMEESIAAAEDAQ